MKIGEYDDGYPDDNAPEPLPEPKAEINLIGGSLDGATIFWPPTAGDFPAIIEFGYYTALPDGKDPLRVPIPVRRIRYEACDTWTEGPILEDGFPQSSIQSYLFAETTTEEIPSVESMWNSPANNPPPKQGE
jgi:hypothetical protein